MKRRQVLKTMAAAAVLRAVPSPAAAADLSKEAWKPRVLDAHQDRTVTVLAELIIPRTDSPGATDAQVNRYIDSMLADSPPSARREFLGGLAWLDGYCNENYGGPFADLQPEQQVEVLKALSSPPSRPIAQPEAYESERALAGTPADTKAETANLAPGARFFRSMKKWTADGYYTSRPGLEQELGWGKNPATEPPGCPHGDKHSL